MVLVGDAVALGGTGVSVGMGVLVGRGVALDGLDVFVALRVAVASAWVGPAVTFVVPVACRVGVAVDSAVGVRFWRYNAFASREPIDPVTWTAAWLVNNTSIITVSAGIRRNLDIIRLAIHGGGAAIYF
jgi:hypothetical protein